MESIQEAQKSADEAVAASNRISAATRFGGSPEAIGVTSNRAVTCGAAALVHCGTIGLVGVGKVATFQMGK